jgi:hypothetical protein
MRATYICNRFTKTTARKRCFSRSFVVHLQINNDNLKTDIDETVKDYEIHY